MTSLDHLFAFVFQKFMKSGLKEYESCSFPINQSTVNKWTEREREREREQTDSPRFNEYKYQSKKSWKKKTEIERKKN